MNTPSPLIPQGATPAKPKVGFFVKVLMMLSIHAIVIGGMLLQGCKDTGNNSTGSGDTASTQPPDTLPPVNPAISNAVSNALTGVPSAPLSAPMNPGSGAPLSPGTLPNPNAPISAPLAPPITQPMSPIPTTSMAAPVSLGDLHEYAIAKGDTLGAIAKKNGVSLTALQTANPGLNPKKLRIGQKIQIPAASASVASASGATAGSADLAGGDTTTYSVKSGDTLGKIAKSYHTSYKKIMAMNDLKTTSIRVGQKLKIPAASAPAAPPAPGGAPATSVTPVMPAPSPASVTTASNQ